MGKNKNIQDKVNSTLNVLDALQTPQVSPFFKDKTMQRMFQNKEEEQEVWSWFTPKIQLATLVCVVVLNIVAFAKMKSSSYDENINDFAETYGLTISTENTFLN